MKKILKWTGIVLGGLIVLLLILVVALYLIGGSKQHKVWKIEPEAVTIPSDAASVARGEHLVRTVAVCVGCHGDNLGGKVLINQPSFAVIYALNLTPGEGGAGAEFKDPDFVRAIRHGVDPDGRALIIMPSQNFYAMSDADLGAVIAYLRTLPPVNNELPDPKLGLLARILLATGMIKKGIYSRLSKSIMQPVRKSLKQESQRNTAITWCGLAAAMIVMAKIWQAERTRMCR